MKARSFFLGLAAMTGWSITGAGAEDLPGSMRDIPLAAVRAASAQTECSLSVKTPFSAVAIYKDTFLAGLENENRLKEICPEQDKDCVAAALAAQTDRMPVHDRPSGKIIASLDVTYAPGEMKAALIQGGEAVPFIPPVYDSDFGYGPWFHATLLDQKGAWKKIALPSIQSGWIELPEAEILQFTEKDRVYSLRARNIVVIKSDGASLTVRDEQPADMWCDGGDPPPLTAFKEQAIPLNEVYDDQCNLLLSPAYTRGC